MAGVGSSPVLLSVYRNQNGQSQNEKGHLLIGTKYILPIPYIQSRKLHNTDTDVVIDALKNQGMKPMVALSLVKRYPKQRIREVINASGKQSEISNKPGWIVKALAADFKFEGGRVEEPPRYKIYQPPTSKPDFSTYKDGIALIRAKIGILK